MADQTINSGGTRDKRGVVHYGPAGDDTITVPKTVAEAAIAATYLADFLPAGYVGEDGVQMSAAKEPDPVKEMGGATVAQLLPEHEHTYTFTLLESAEANTLKLLHGEENVDVAPEGITVRSNSSLPEQRPFILTVLDKNGRREVHAIPSGQATISGEVTYSAGEVISYEVTLSTFPDEDGNNVYQHFLSTGTTNTVSG